MQVCDFFILEGGDIYFFVENNSSLVLVFKATAKVQPDMELFCLHMLFPF